MAILKKNAFSRRVPDLVTEELVAVLSRRASFEFKQLFEIVHENLRARNAASGGEEMLRLRAYEKLQNLVARGMVKKDRKEIQRTAFRSGQSHRFRQTDIFPATAAALRARTAAIARLPLLLQVSGIESNDPRDTCSALLALHAIVVRSASRRRVDRQRAARQVRAAHAHERLRLRVRHGPQGEAQPRFSVKFYLVAMLFILFDLEIVFMYPWAVVYREAIAQSQVILWSMLSFVSILMVGYVYALKKGALDWKK